MCHNMETSYMDFGYDTHIQLCPNTMHFSLIQAPQVDSTNLSPPKMNITPMDYSNSISMMDSMTPFCVEPVDRDDSVVVELEDDDNPDVVDNVSHENSMQVTAQGLEDDDEEVEAGYANNEYVEPENPHPDELEGDG